ncbi:PREDICTED: uncharacterized protein LOC108767162 [Trachymyrmex cornetzi]|uniref:uncharacterized protein LOC108767162 n=1 Tax=Trachymyrmex cornetzi TaxID=471704 RepID=UPI00084F0245|nr:PREDICTED: uncharacterized protein LOC108767162 [Trachymyrmex cornetzi]
MSKKKNVWSQIAKEMMILGYNFSNRDPGTVCSQKWRNMEGKTITFIQNGGSKSTGAGKLKKPAFYDEVRDIIKDSAKATPVNLMDTMSDLSSQTSSSSVSNDFLKSSKCSQEFSCSAKDSDEPLSDDDAKELISNQKKVSPFLKVQNTTKAKKRKIDNSALLNFLKQDSEERKTQNKNLVQLLTKKMEQEKESKKQMLEILSNYWTKYVALLKT